MERQRSLLIICQSCILLTLDLIKFIILQMSLMDPSSDPDYCSDVRQQLRDVQNDVEVFVHRWAMAALSEFRIGLHFYPMLCLDSSFRSAVRALFLRS